jgi:hypothetical protein
VDAEKYKKMMQAYARMHFLMCSIRTYDEAFYRRLFAQLLDGMTPEDAAAK